MLANAIHLFFQNFGFFVLASAFLNFTVGILVLSRDPRSKIHFSFFLFTFHITLWLLFYGLFLRAGTAAAAFGYFRWAYLFGVPFISPSTYIFSVHWTGRYEEDKRKVWAGYGVALLLAIFIFKNVERVYSLNTHEWGYFIYLRFTPLSIAYFSCLQILFFSFAIMGVINVYRARREAISPNLRIQYRNFMLAAALGYTGSVDFLTVMGFKVFPFGFISATVFSLILAYTIARHQFLNVNLALKKLSLILLIYALLLGILSPVIGIALSNYIHEPPANPVLFILLLAVGVGAFFSLGPWIYAYLTRRTFWLKTNESTGLAHELKSPLATIASATDVLLASMRAPAIDREKTCDYLDIIHRNSTRLEQFVHNLLDIAKIQDGTFIIEKELFDISKTIEREVEYHRPLMAKQGIEFQGLIEPSIQFEGDEEKIRQCASNLLSNALKFTHKGRIRFSLHRNSNHLICAVADSGRGIPSKDLNKIFERFYHGKHSSKGSGVGLAIAKAWVEAHGGKIWAESKGEEKGTTVTFTLPSEK